MKPHTASEISAFLRYDPQTGEFYWKMARGNRFPAGSKAGRIGPEGYVTIGVEGRYYRAHRLAVLLMSGLWPDGVVDHINCDRSDNRWENLRVVTHAQNCRNQVAAKSNRSGFKGVYWHKGRSRWTASIRLDWVLHHLGYFDTKEEAALAYNRASSRLHGKFGRPSTRTMLKRVEVDA